MRQLTFGIPAEAANTELFYEKCIKNMKSKTSRIGRVFAVRLLAFRAYNPIIWM